MNLLLLEPHEVGADGKVRLTGRRADHLRKVLRVEAGRQLRIGVLDRGAGVGVVEAVEGDEVWLLVEAVDEPPSTPSVDLVVALPRPQALHRLLQWTATMGVGRLDLVNAWRVEKSFFSSPSVFPESLRKHLLIGAEQGRQTRLPEVHVQKLLVPFLESLGSETDGRPCRRLLAHPGVSCQIEEAWEEGPAERIHLAIGPEGGWIDREVQTFSEAGFQPVSLGPWILRVETAIAAALAQIELLQRGRISSPPATGAC